MEDLSAMLADLSRVSDQVDLKMNMDKTKVMSNDVQVVPTPVIVGGSALEVVDDYVYLGQTVQLGDLACIFPCMVQHASVQKLMSFLIETLPAYFLDLLRILGRQSPRYIRSISKLANLRNELRVFTSTTWQFRCERALALATTQPAAAGPFPCCARNIQWRPYLAACHRGVVAYLFNRNSNVNAGGTYRRLDF
ncbi:hypothetical protein MSG28_006541 [Choristoneura fumiferana]|uniref:Uncharacterized protein n=1 Tax=Choristoneura fumiferana TaxID=7141 RepID=A0ACC0JF56_CHOFU|nr:hypothetical protein MSG28_006541 [Choristoneura fumiferana]